MAWSSDGFGLVILFVMMDVVVVVSSSPSFRTWTHLRSITSTTVQRTVLPNPALPLPRVGPNGIYNEWDTNNMQYFKVELTTAEST